MSYFCHKCLNDIDILSDKVGFRDECISCKSDLHVCKNCLYYDHASYNECRESQAERVLEKERANFCDYFVYKDLKSKPTKTTKDDNPLKKLDDLFK